MYHSEIPLVVVSFANLCCIVTTKPVTTPPHLPLVVVDISSSVYWRHPFKAVCSPRQLTEYFVLQTEPLVSKAKGSGVPGCGAADGAKDRFQLMDLWVTRSKDVGIVDQQTHVRTHLGHLLNPGDTAMGWVSQHPLTHTRTHMHTLRGEEWRVEGEEGREGEEDECGSKLRTLLLKQNEVLMSNFLASEVFNFESCLHLATQRFSK